MALRSVRPATTLISGLVASAEEQLPHPKAMQVSSPRRSADPRGQGQVRARHRFWRATLETMLAASCSQSAQDLKPQADRQCSSHEIVT